MAGLFSRFIFNNAIFNTGTSEEVIVGDGWLKYDPHAQRALQDYRLAAERQRIKEDEIIRLRLEAQDTLLRKRELENAKSAADKRRLQKLEEQYLSLQAELLAQLLAIDELRKKTTKYRNNMVILLMHVACPFNVITFH